MQHPTEWRSVVEFFFDYSVLVQLFGGIWNTSPLGNPLQESRWAYCRGFKTISQFHFTMPSVSHVHVFQSKEDEVKKMREELSELRGEESEIERRVEASRVKLEDMKRSFSQASATITQVRRPLVFHATLFSLVFF